MGLFLKRLLYFRKRRKPFFCPTLCLACYNQREIYFGEFQESTLATFSSKWSYLALNIQIHGHSIILLLFPFPCLAAPVAYECSWARDQIQAASVTYATTVATPDP